MSMTALKLLVILSGLLNAYCTPALDVRQAEPNIPSPWISTGCFSDTPASITLRVASFTDVTNMTIEVCLSFCTSPVAYNLQESSSQGNVVRYVEINPESFGEAHATA
ncbi:hypothetical protein CPC08DRAFT_820748 [Agrocybe pediades]|nr:hypothetical protein CPC08DRAFT_820748 [Agrocybe pediades]